MQLETRYLRLFVPQLLGSRPAVTLMESYASSDNTNRNNSRSASAESSRADRENIFDAFRRWGYLQAQLDLLGRLLPDHDPELDIPGDVAEAARRVYCGRIGADFMHIPQPDRRRWIHDRMESPPATPDRAHILERIL